MALTIASLPPYLLCFLLPFFFESCWLGFGREQSWSLWSQGKYILTSCGSSSKRWEINQGMGWFRRKHSGLTGRQMLFPELLEPLFAYGGIHADLEEVVVFMQMHKTLKKSVSCFQGSPGFSGQLRWGNKKSEIPAGYPFSGISSLREIWSALGTWVLSGDNPNSIGNQLGKAGKLC